MRLPLIRLKLALLILAVVFYVTISTVNCFHIRRPNICIVTSPRSSCLLQADRNGNDNCDPPNVETLDWDMTKGRGLTSNINVRTADYYTPCLPMNSSADLAWCTTPGLFWKAVVADAEEKKTSPEVYLTQVVSALAIYRKSKKVHDREGMYSFLRGVEGGSFGNLKLVLGGKSIGKSLVLKDFANTLDSNKFAVILVDARLFSGRTLAAGIRSSYKERLSVVTNPAIKSFLNVVNNVIENLIKSGNVTGVKATFKETTNEVEVIAALGRQGITDSEAIQVFVNDAVRQEKSPVLIIDEANNALGVGKGASATNNTLATIVSLTKQQNLLEVIMASPEYGFPYKLERNGLNRKDISGILFAGEIPPKSMWELLVTKVDNTTGTSKPVIGMGENLARMLIDSHGGHFLDMQNAVENLLVKKEFFSAVDSFNSISNGIKKCMRQYGNTTQILRQMAQRGFAPVDEYDDPAVQMIVTMNIGGIVQRSKSILIGLSDLIWIDYPNFEYGLVPTSESARILIAELVLAQEAKEKLSWNKKTKKLSFCRWKKLK